MNHIERSQISRNSEGAGEPAAIQLELLGTRQPLSSGHIWALASLEAYWLCQPLRLGVLSDTDS